MWMLKLLSPIDYCQGIRRERGTLLLILFFVKHEVYVDIDVPLKYHDERLTLDVIAERRSADNNPVLYIGFLDLGLERTLPSSACRAVLQFPWLLCLLVGKLVTSFSIAPISILIVSFGWSVPSRSQSRSLSACVSVSVLMPVFIT